MDSTEITNAKTKTTDRLNYAMPSEEWKDLIIALGLEDQMTFDYVSNTDFKALGNLIVKVVIVIVAFSLFSTILGYVLQLLSK